jgi:hypothetical protein
MSGHDTELGPVLERIVAVLAYALLLALAGLIVLGVAGGDAGVRMTLTHVIETLVGVFIGIAAARLSANGSSRR